MDGRYTARRGFTLVELLVAISVFLILTTLAVGTFNLNIGDERIGACARILQAKFEGARSRAFGLSQQSRSSTPIGIRFVLDQNDPTLATGLVYVEGVKDVPRGRLRFVDLDPNPAPNERVGIQYVTGLSADNRSWGELARIGLLQPGVRITIDDRFTYQIASESFLPPFLEDQNAVRYSPNVRVYREVTQLDGTVVNEGTVLRTVEEPVDTAALVDPAIGGNNRFVVNQGRLYDFEFDLSTITFPMAGEEVELFPTGTVVDLANSVVPSSWSVSRWEAGRGYLLGQWIVTSINGQARFANVLRAGTSGGSIPNFDVAKNTTVTDGSVIWRVSDLNLEIMFNPNGSVNGVEGASGVLHFLVAERIDTDRNLNLFLSPDGDPTTPDLGDVQGSYRVVTLYTNSGTVIVSPADLTDSDGSNGVDDLFRFAREGAVAK